MRRWKVLLVFTASVLMGCAQITRQTAQRFVATTNLEGDSVIVTVTNLGPADVWFDPNHCPRAFKVGVQERLPSVPTLLGGKPINIGIYDVCTMELRPPELWKVRETKSGVLPNTRLLTGSYTVTAWAEPVVAPNIAGKPGQFQTVRVQAPTVVLTAP